MAGGATSLKILIVEDEPPIQSILKELLIYAGYEVTIASNCVETLELFQRNKYELVLLDIMMPKLDDYGACKTIRETGGTPVIMLTALDEEEA